MINAAIVGLGRWGQNLVNSVQGKSEKIRFVAGVLRRPENAREYAERQGLTLHSDYSKVLRDPAIDAIVLATPHTAHAAQIMAAVEAGKPVFTEKPFTLTSESALRALKAAARRNVTVGVGFNWRFQPALQEMRRMLGDGRLGELLHIEGNFCGPSVYRFPKAHWRQQRDEGPAGGMTGRGVHVVDAMLYLAGHIDTVHAQSYRIALDYGIDDTTSMLFRFRSGATGYLSTIIATAETWRMQVFGSKGWAEVGDVEHLTTWQMKVCYVDPTNLHNHQRPQIVTFAQTSTERAELENFADAVREKRPLAIAGGDEEHGVTVLEAILESAASGRTVTVAAAAPAQKKRAVAKTATKRAAAKAKRAVKTVGKALRQALKKATRGAAGKRKARQPARKKTTRQPAKKTTARKK
ncbi:MAG TPA: Gfo/Idh/MocA family oxidoreductase [Burkholderiales bacterium]|nr:Gfo/Idh/MocA family oxidoreductase [Burkholderiales bacterium]